MNTSVIDLTLSATRHRPGDTLSGRFRIAPHLPADTTSVELSVLWLTTRKRLSTVDEEIASQIGVIGYQAWTAERGTLSDLPEDHAFAFPLPIAPWTYAGFLFRIQWLVRVRLRFGPHGEEVREVGFTLTPPGR
jgi:hypothetical protein